MVSTSARHPRVLETQETFRMEVTKNLMTQPQGQVPDAVNVKTMGFAIHETLVQKTWSAAIDRVGLGETWTNMRMSLQDYIKGEDMSPKHPSESELMFMMGRLGRSRIDWEKLLFEPFETCIPEADPKQCAELETGAQSTVPATPMPPPAKATSAVSERAWHERAFLPTTSGGQPLILKRLPPARNVNVEPESITREGPSAGTRTQTKKRATASLVCSEAVSSGLQR